MIARRVAGQGVVGYKNSTSRGSQTDWEYVDALQDEDIDLSDIPEVTAEQMARAQLRVGANQFLKARCASACS